MRKLIRCYLVVLFLGLTGAGQYGLAQSPTDQSALDRKIAEAITTLVCEEPTEQDPVSLNAALVTDGDSLAVIVKASMAPGWHIYQYVPPNMPYIALDHILHLPQGIEAVGNWEASEPIPSVTDRGVLIHEEEAWFVQKGRKVEKQMGGSAVVRTGLYYQTCDHRQCLPAVEKTIDINLNTEK